MSVFTRECNETSIAGGKKNPCTLVPFLFLVFLCAVKNEIGLSFSFFNFPRREQNGIRIHFMLSDCLFSIALEKTDFNFLFPFSFFVFRFRMEFGKRITSRVPFFFFL